MTEMFKTSLYEEHVALNAKIVPFAGWAMPVQYTSVKDECIAVRNNVGVFDVSHMGEFFVEGTEAVKFVDHLITNDFANAPIGKAVYSPLCNQEGKILDDLICYKLSPTKVLVCVNASNIDKDFNWFKKNHHGFDCSLTNKSQDYSLLAVQGPNTVKTLAALGGLSQIDTIPYYGVSEVKSELGNFILARTGYTGEDGFEIFGDHLAIKKIWKFLISNKVTPCGLAARDVLRLEVCFPLYGHELDESVTPLDAGLKWTVKTDKINFIGKDAIIKTSPKYLLLKLSLEKAIPREGYEVIQNDSVIGKITSGTMSVALNYGVALARVDLVKFNPNSEIFINIRNKNYPAKLSKKPFLTGGHK